MPLSVFVRLWHLGRRHHHDWRDQARCTRLLLGGLIASANVHRTLAPLPYLKVRILRVASGPDVADTLF